MLIPIDERMATRAHAVFDVVYVKKLNIINLDSHVKRLLKSAESVEIKPPLSH
jgi:branched-subunit amino acid aminotransferase/4-amino-4-deoxychorismate lyase